ncbi:hypothetical protein MPLSOD_40838 [Mesorhizobium sp. SOD10]|nr:hypothetical protein MPLSOD_40838 [Mesorhizobium sp. SOD10]
MGMMPNRRAAVKSRSQKIAIEKGELVLQPSRLEGAGDHFLAHTVEQGERRGLAIGAQHLAESRLQCCFGDDFRFDAGRQAFRPGFAVALHGSQALFFPDQRVDVADTMFHCDVHLLQAAIRPMDPAWSASSSAVLLKSL